MLGYHLWPVLRRPVGPRRDPNILYKRHDGWRPYETYEDFKKRVGSSDWRRPVPGPTGR